MLKPALACLAVLALASCATAPATHPLDATAASPGQATVVVPERYVSADDPTLELDSLATWPTEDGHTWLIATAKSVHRLVVFDADSGRQLQSIGARGSEPGQFMRPNGVAVFGDRLFVTERDNHRVQVLSLPDFRPLGSFGERQLRSPYGLWIDETGPDEYEVYVTDSFMDGARHELVPPLDQLDQRVHRFHLDFDDDGRLASARDDGAFGETSEARALRIVESIAGDPAQRHLLIADEFTGQEGDRRGSTLREYDFDGRATGRQLPDGSFQGEAEGVALWACTADTGYWVAVDQTRPLTRFLLFDRATLAPRGSFTGETTAYTDGIVLHAASTTAFASGALFAVHDDQAVAAFDLGDIVRALALDPRCTQ